MKKIKRVGICTLFTGYNYGSALQALALKKTVGSLGYQPDLIKISGSIVSGRDIRLKKLMITTIRMLLYSHNISKSVQSFTQHNKGKINFKTVQEFNDFYDHYLKPRYMSYHALKKDSHNYDFFICGSDQIWNSTAFYVDPFYYLAFVSNKKRIAYAPSFGKEYVPKYNQKKIKRLLNGFKDISVREDSGKEIIKELLDRDVPICLDPTLLLTKEEWKKILNIEDSHSESYLLVYFLSTPSEKAKYFIQKLAISKNLKIYFMNKSFEIKSDLNIIYGGPRMFVKSLMDADYIVTDSFHGVAFSIIFQKKFFVFDREYVTENQSTRITSLLKVLSLEYLFDPEDFYTEIDYQKISKILKLGKESSINYLKKALDGEL